MRRKDKQIGWAIVTFLIYMLSEACLIPPAHALPSSRTPIPSEGPSALHPATGEFTFVDDQAGVFAVFEDGDTSRFPRTIGRVLWLGGKRVLIPTREIVSLEELYLLKDPGDPLHLEVVEKLPNGGFGRLLRYRGLMRNEDWADVEFVYQDRENGLVALNYESGRFYRILMRQKMPVPHHIFPRGNVRLREKSAASFDPFLFKFTLAGGGEKNWVIPGLFWPRSQYESLSGEEIWASRLIRGPPMEGLEP